MSDRAYRLVARNRDRFGRLAGTLRGRSGARRGRPAPTARSASRDSPAPRLDPRRSRRLVAAYAATVVLWRDPATDLYARWKQHTLSQALDEAFAEQEPIVALPAASWAEPTDEELLVTEKLAVARAANELHEKLKLGRRSAGSRCPAWG